MQPDLPPRFVRTQIDMHGEFGRAWLDNLPTLLAEVEADWGLGLESPFADLSFHYVAPGVQSDGAAVVLKAGIPHKEMESEIAALRTFDGRGAVRLLRADEERGILLLERVQPGTTLVGLPEDIAMEIASRVMRALWRPVPSEGPFQTLRGWVEGFRRLRSRFDGGTGPLPPDLIEHAEHLGADLLTSCDLRLIHGDLHHANILQDGETWKAIDPKGLIGDPAYEPAPFLGNPRLEETGVLGRRIAVFSAELGIDAKRIQGWGVVHAAMSAWWTIEDGGDGWEQPVELARRLQSLDA